MSKTILLTGASRGIGLSIAHYILSQPSKHNLIAVSRTEEPLRALQSQYSSERVDYLAVDLSDLSSGEKVVQLALQKFGKLDGVIVNHGVLDPVKRVEDSTAEEWRDAYTINFFSAVAIVKAAIPALRESKGTILFTSSGAASNSYSTWGAYGSAKAAMNHFAATLGNEEKDITSIAIRPGVVDTEMQRDIREKHRGSMDAKDAAKFAELKETGGLLRPEQPGHVMAKLVLDAPKELSGKFLTWNAEELRKFQE
ncbi:Benzil reductase ((S)-benzoin forming) IRC24 [Pseudocercospora fuligena]|uniref:Benzil reductase ((S)-benzoin forming) IRC24 n=1 Tax=Pseudocercospora fuligena TaxID=685502 RepID=A0A8H6R944_9PEZI|nr:Benzil reductase ((S)-benzoin forming) IRC24 [Pseudocercospora fuligena]